MLIFDFPDIILKVLIGVYSLYSEVKLLLDFLTDRHFCGGSKKSFFHGFHKEQTNFGEKFVCSFFFYSITMISDTCLIYSKWAYHEDIL